jgi:hypothetical protein
VEKHIVEDKSTLRKLIFQKWEKVDLQTIHNLINSMEKRITQVIDREGKTTNY